LSKTKSFRISKALIRESYQRVKKNRGGYGVDHCSIADFEKDLKNNLSAYSTPSFQPTR